MKSIISFLMMLTITIGLSAQDNGEVKPITLPGKGNINVETLNKRINTKMDISCVSCATPSPPDRVISSKAAN